MTTIRGFNIIFCLHNVVYFDVFFIKGIVLRQKNVEFFSSLYFILFTVKLIENKALLLMCVGIKYFNQCWTKDFPQKPNINIYMLTQRNLSLWDVDKGQLMKELCPFILLIETMNDECHFNISKCFWKLEIL